MKKSLVEKVKEKEREEAERLRFASRLNGVSVNVENPLENKSYDFCFDPENFLDRRQTDLDIGLGHLCYVKKIKVVDDDTFVLKGRVSIFKYHRLVKKDYLKMLGRLLTGRATLNEIQLEEYQSREAVREANGGQFSPLPPRYYD